MTVFVDDAYMLTEREGGGKMKLSHMIADSERELHQMAEQLGISRKHFTGEFYSVCSTKRREALSAGAKALGWLELSRIVFQRRAGK